MKDAAFVTSLLINIGLCIFAVVQFKKRYNDKHLQRWQAFLLYSIAALLVALLSGFGLFSILIDFYEGLGFIQELGHHAVILISIFQFLSTVVTIPVGIIIINKKVGANS